MTKKNVGANSVRPRKNKKTNKRDIVKILIPLIGIIIFIYALYKIIDLIVVPTDIVMIENGIIYNEEDAIRLCYKR